MNFSNSEGLTRRRFIKGLTAGTICCACPRMDHLAASEENLQQEGKNKEHLVAACGTYCGACPAYLSKHDEDKQVKRKPHQRPSSGSMETQKGIPPPNWMDGLVCDGCLSGGELAWHCKNCSIRLCAAKKMSDFRCSHCEELPCSRITTLINMGNYFHRKEYLPNLKKIREMGAGEWVKREEERWRCPRCGLPMSWYDTECARCGEPRSGRVFSLTEDKM